MVQALRPLRPLVCFGLDAGQVATTATVKRALSTNETACATAVLPAGQPHHRYEGLVRNKAVYLALAITCQGEKEVLGLWIEQTEGVKFWLKVMNELRTRGSGGQARCV